MIMKLFSRWKKGNTETLFQNKKPIIIRNKHSLFDDIVGFEDVKALFEMAIKAERPVHLLLCGPPASAKSLFMRSLTRFERSYYAVGSSSTKSGIFDYLFEHRPRYFIIDELEKINKEQPSLRHGYLLHVIVLINFYHHYLQDLEIFISSHIQKRNLSKLL